MEQLMPMKFGLSIKDSTSLPAHQFGLVVAGDMAAREISVQAEGFTPDTMGAWSLLAMLEATVAAFRVQLQEAEGEPEPVVAGQGDQRFVPSPITGDRLDHNILDPACVDRVRVRDEQHLESLPTSGGARCPVCRAVGVPTTHCSDKTPHEPHTYPSNGQRQQCPGVVKRGFNPTPLVPNKEK